MAGAEHERTKEPLPIRPPRPHPYLVLAYVAPEPSRSPRPTRPGDSEPGVWRGQGGM